MGQIRRIESLGIARESDSTPGTAVALATGMCFGVSSGILKPVVEYTPNPANFGVNFMGAESFVTHKRSELTFTAPLKTDWLGFFLAGILGSVSSSDAAGETLVREHEFSLASGCVLPSYTMFILNSIQDKMATMGTVKRVVISCPSNGLATVTVEMVGQAFENGSGTAVYADDHHLQGSMLAVKTALAVGGLPAATAIDMHGFTITFEREIIAKQVFANLEPTKFYAGPLKVTVELQNTYEADTYRDIYESGENWAWRFDFQDTDTTLGNAENPGLTIDLNRTVISGYSRPEGIDEDDVETITLTGLYDTDDLAPQFGLVTLTNEESATAYTTP